MNKKILLLLLLIFIMGVEVFPQKALYDIVYYDEPPKWKKDEKPAHLSYTFINNVRGSYGMIVIYPSIKSSGDADKDHLDSWNQLVKPTFGAGIMPKSTKAQRGDGYQVLTTGDVLDVKGKQTTVLLMDFTGYGRTVTLILSYTDESYSPSIITFIKSISFKDHPIQQTPVVQNVQSEVSDDSPLAQTRSNIGNSATSSLIGTEGISGVWMSMVAQADFMNSGFSTSLKCIIVFTDGQFRENMPLEGFHFFDIDRDKRLHPNNWGTVSGSKGSYSVLKPGAGSYKGTITAGNERITFDGDSYVRVKPFNGLKLNGSWSSLANPDEDLKVGNLEPVISFYSDGRFEDKGILLALDISANESQKQGGKGKYEINDYTLSLRYDDGRIRNYSITGLFTGAGQNDKTLVVCDVTLRKRSR